MCSPVIRACQDGAPFTIQHGKPRRVSPPLLQETLEHMMQEISIQQKK